MLLFKLSQLRQVDRAIVICHQLKFLLVSKSAIVFFIFKATIIVVILRALKDFIAMAMRLQLLRCVELDCIDILIISS